MLTMTNALTVRGATVYQDDANELAAFEQSIADRPTWTIDDQGQVQQVKGQGLPTGADTTALPKYYLLPESPQIAKDPKGNPLFSLIVYRKDEAAITDPTTQQVGGGIMAFTVELVSPAFDQVKADLAKQAGTDVDLAYVQFIDGSVTVTVAGESGDPTDNEFVRTLVGSGKLGGVGANRRAVTLKLTQDGASLFAQLDKLKTLPINVQYSLTFEHRLLGVKMIAFCDIESSYVLIQTLREQDSSYDDGYLGLSTEHQDDRIVQQSTEALVNAKTMYVTVIPMTSQVDQDTLTALEKAGLDMLNKEVAGVLAAGPPPEGIDRNQLTKFQQTYNSSLNYTIDRRMVLTQLFTPSANLSNMLVGANLDDLVAYVDLRTAFFTFLQVPVQVNADFDKLPISSVTVTVTYNRTAVGGGAAQQVRDSFNITTGAQIEKFLAYANSLAEVSYDWSAEIHYKDSDATYTMGKKGVKDNFLVIDVGQIGILSTEFALGLVDTDSYPIAVVSTRYHSSALGRDVGTQLRLDKDNPSAPWTAVIQETPDNGFEYKVDWLHVIDKDKPPEIRTGTWTRSSDSRLQLDAPLGQEMTVTVFCSGNFKDGADKLSQVAVALHYEDTTNNHIVDGQVTFTDDKQSAPWTVDLIDPSKRDYTYQYSNIYEGGVVKRYPADGSWLPGDPGYITVGEKYSMSVDLYPTLLTFGTDLAAVEVDTDYQDPAHSISLADTFVFTGEALAKQTWHIKGDQNGPHEFGYVVRYFYKDGTTVVTPRAVQSSDALFVPPPAPRGVTPPPAPAPTPAPPPPAQPAQPVQPVVVPVQPVQPPPG
jgi:hypothetical protein